MIAKTFRVLWMLFKMKLAKTMVFRFNFFGVFFVDGSLFLMQLLMFTSIYEQVGSIGGWQRGEMLIFIGTFSIINALNMHLFFFGIISIPGKIRSGELDFYIVKPISSLLHLSFEHIDIGSIPLVIASIGLVIYGAIVDSITVSVLTVVGYSFMVLCMVVLWYDIMVIIRTIPFFVINASSLENFEGELLTLCMKIPGTLFKHAFKVIFYLLLPYGIMSTLPSQLLIGTLSGSGFIYGVAVVFLFTVITLKFWRFGLRHYKSASS